MSEIQLTVGGQSFTFGRNELVTIGRAKDALVSIDDKTVSRKHGDLRFETNLNAWVYTDLASGNGSYINGMAIMNAQLTLPAVIKLGEQDDAITLRVSEIVAEPAMVAPVAEQVPVPAPASCSKCAKPINQTFGPRCPACDTLIHRNCWESINGCTNSACSAKGTN